MKLRLLLLQFFLIPVTLQGMEKEGWSNAAQSKALTISPASLQEQAFKVVAMKYLMPELKKVNAYTLDAFMAKLLDYLPSRLSEEQKKDFILNYLPSLLINENMPLIFPAPYLNSSFIEMAFSGCENYIFSNDSSLAAVLFSTRRLNLVNPSKKSSIQLNHGADITAYTFSLQGDILVTGDEDQNLYFWDTASAQRVNQLVIPEICKSLVFSHDGKTLVFASSQALYFLQPNVDNPQEWQISFVKKVSDTAADIAVSFSSDDLKLAVSISSLQSKSVNIWTRIDKDFCNSWKISPVLEKKRVYAVAFSPNRNLLVISTDSAVSVMAIQENTCTLCKTIKTKQPITSITFSPHSAQLCALSNDKKKAYIFDVETWSPCALLKGEKATRCIFTSDSRCLFGERLHNLKVIDINHLFSALVLYKAQKRLGVASLEALESTSTLAQLPDSIKEVFKANIVNGKNQTLASKVEKFAWRNRICIVIGSGVLMGSGLILLSRGLKIPLAHVFLGFIGILYRLDTLCSRA